MIGIAFKSLCFITVSILLAACMQDASPARPSTITSRSVAPLDASAEPLPTQVPSAEATSSTTTFALRPKSPTPVPDIELGKKVYMSYCKDCHPLTGMGSGPNLKGEPADRVERAIRSGAGPSRDMPPFTADVIDDEELTNLVAYVASLE